MCNSYTLYPAEHVRTAREQREEDIRALAKLSADLGRPWLEACFISIGGVPCPDGGR
jgi:hypothetical protein